MDEPITVAAPAAPAAPPAPHPGYPRCRCGGCAHDYVCPPAVVLWLRALLVGAATSGLALALLPG